MKKASIFSLIFLSFCFNAQEISSKLGLFGSVDANIGFDVAGMIKQSQATTEYEKQQLKPGKFNYGFSAQAGYQFANWFALGSGLRYSYVDPNFHVVYWNVQPYFFLGNSKSEDYTYISASFGKQINHTASRNAKNYGIYFGKFEPINSHLGNKFQISLDVQDFDGNGTLFLGITYGLVFFSNKK